MEEVVNKLVITIEVPDGVVPDVQYATTPDAAPPIVQEVDAPEFPPFPPAKQLAEPSCRVHHKPMRHGRLGWYCPTKLPDGSWCSETA